MFEIEWRNWCERYAIHMHGCVLCVKTALGIVPTVGVYAIANLEPANTWTELDDCAGPIRAENQRETDATVWGPAIANVSIPSAHSRGMHRDQDFSRPWLRNREIVEREHLGAAIPIKSDGAHDGRNLPLLCSRGAPSLGSLCFCCSVCACLHFSPLRDQLCLGHLFIQISQNVCLLVTSLS